MPEASTSSGFYQLRRNQSSASIFEDVEMAHNEVRHQPRAHVACSGHWRCAWTPNSD
jgi:hypothetical protein